MFNKTVQKKMLVLQTKSLLAWVIEWRTAQPVARTPRLLRGCVGAASWSFISGISLLQ